uniref:FAM83 domain-containing protein n=1 Tax=Macrostomum lignano TaxID=282301 RepID=A0A1I8FJV5_9PLAT
GSNSSSSSNKEQQQQQQQQREEDPEEQFVERLGSRLVRQPPSDSNRWASYDDEAEEDAETPKFRDSLEPSQASQPDGQLFKTVRQQRHQTTAAPAVTESGQNFSIRKGGNQLANLLPHQPAAQPPPPPPPPPAPPAPLQPALGTARHLASRAQGGSRWLFATGLWPLLGPFRWSVDRIEAPATLDEADRPQTATAVLCLMDAARPAVQIGSGDDADFSPSGPTVQQTMAKRLPTCRPSAGVCQPWLLAAAAAAPADQILFVDEELTRLLAGTLAANGASLMIASSNSAELPSSASHRQNGDQLKKPQLSMPRWSPERRAAPAWTRSARSSSAWSIRLRSESRRSEVGESGLRDRLKTASESARRRLSPARAAAVGDHSTVKPASAVAAAAARQCRRRSYQSLYESAAKYMQENESLRTEKPRLVKSQGDRLQE